MSWSCSVRLMTEHGRPARGVKVVLSFSGHSGSLRDSTDNDGWVQFELSNEDASYRRVRSITAYIGIMGKEVNLDDEVRIEDGETLSYTLSDEDCR